MRVKAALMGCMFAAGLFISGCHKEPKGQVVAIVNGDEVSMQELNAELQAIRMPVTADRNAVRNQVLQRLIDRKLIVQKAREQGLDKTPEFVTRQRQLEENLLASMLGQKIATTVPMPDDHDITQYIADNPTQFGGRQRLLLDQIRFAAPKEAKRLLALRNAHSLDDIAADLTTLGVRFSRGKGAIDTGPLDPQLTGLINRLPPGEPFVLPSNGEFVASVVVGRDSIPTPAGLARRAAAQLVRQRELTAESKAQVARERADAEVKYQQGFAPAAKLN